MPLLQQGDTLSEFCTSKLCQEGTEVTCGWSFEMAMSVPNRSYEASRIMRNDR